jgi:iron transport multicopper oxidase
MGAGHFDPNNPPEFPSNPVRRDVILVNAGGYAVLAFRADNPGAWYDPSNLSWLILGICTSSILFLTNYSSHCHIDWHLIAGMVAQFIEAPFEMQKRLVVPGQITQECVSQGIPISGKAA